MIKKIIRSCVKCKKLYGKPCEQFMAELPAERVAANQPAFSCVGVDVFGPFLVKYGWSQDDQKVISLWEEKSKLVENHYVVPIPWKDPHEAIPNNFGLAKGRLDFLVKKLQKQNLVSKYEGEIEKLLDKSYAEMIAEEEVFSSTRVWYLPYVEFNNIKLHQKICCCYG